MRPSFRFLILLGFLFQVFHNALASETVMLKDYGHYSLDYSDLANIRWQFERQYEMVINQPSDVDILKNVIIETNNQDKEKLIQANTWIKRSAGGGKHYPMDSFKMQPFDAIWTEYLLTAEDLKVGDTLMVRYKIQADITTTLHEWTLQYAYPVRESRVSFIIPEAFSYADHVTDRQYLQSERTLDSTIVIGQGLSKARIPQKGLVMTFKDIPAYKVEIFGPPLIELRPAFLLNITEAFVGQEGVFLPPWSEQFSDLAVGDFFGKQYRVKLAYRWLSDAASKILSTNYSDRLFVLKLYEFIHQRFSWDGSFGLFPSRTIADMRSEKSVNKSAMNMALLALLNEAGFDAYPVLVTTTDQRPVYEEIPSVNQFNHFVIEVNLDDGKLYVDAGIPTLPPGWIDAGIRKDRAIQIKNYKGNWITIPEAATSSNLDIKMNVKGDYSATGTIHASFTGYDAFSERNQLRDDPTGHYWKQRAEALSPSIRIDSVKYVHVKNLNRPFENIVHFHIEPSDDQAELVINSVPYSFFNQVYFIDSLRANPIMFPLKIVEHTELTILKDPNLKVVSAPQAQKLRLEGNPSNMAFLISDTNSQFQSNFNIQFSKRKFSQVEYNALKTYLSKVSDLIAKPLVITK